MGDTWVYVLDVVVVLGAAAVFGLIFEKIGLGSVPGYLVAGLIVGPSILNLIEGQEVINTIAEVGVALLLFTIGLEFSWKRLVGFGGRAVIAGGIALVAVNAVFTALCLSFGLEWRAAFAIGAAASIGSTAMVLRILRTRNDMDSAHGRFSVAILLTQDVALIPLVLIVAFLANPSGNLATSIGSALLNTTLLVLGMTLFISLVVPRLMDEKVVAKNREIPILIAVATAVGATWAAHALGISPALGAFMAGLLLAEGRFADQMRADALPLRTLFMAVFFVSIGLLVDLHWIGDNVGLVLGATTLLIIGKAIFTYFSVRPFQVSIVQAMATAIAIAQVGEFSFVLLDVARDGGLIDLPLFKLATSVTLLTLFITPFMTGNAYKIALRIAKTFVPKRKLAQAERKAHQTPDRHGHIIVIGFGAAGRAAATTLFDENESVLVLDLSPQLIREAQRCGLGGMVGDATQHTNLERASIESACAVVIAVPDHTAVRAILSQCKHAAPNVPVIVRSRYHVFSDELDVLGADVVLDEEQTVGLLLGRKTLGIIRAEPVVETLTDSKEPS